MSAGHHLDIAGIPDNHYHSEHEWLEFCKSNPGILEWLGRTRRICHDFHIPYLGGISEDGNVVYIERRFNPILRLKSRTFDACRSIPEHECTEYYCVVALGMDYRDNNVFKNPHIWGNTMERICCMGAGVDWEEYNEVIDRQLGDIETETFHTIPLDLALYPYKGDPPLFKRIIEVQKNEQ